MAYSKVTDSSLFDNFVTLQALIKEVLSIDVGSDFKIQYLKKQTCRRAGNVVSHINCDAKTILRANAFIVSCSNA